MALHVTPNGLDDFLKRQGNKLVLMGIEICPKNEFPWQHQMIAPEVDRLAREGKAVVAKVDVDAGEDAMKYGISAMPTFKLFRDSKELGSVQGADIRGVEGLIMRHAGSARGGGGGGVGGVQNPKFVSELVAAFGVEEKEAIRVLESSGGDLAKGAGKLADEGHAAVKGIVLDAKEGSTTRTSITFSLHTGVSRTFILPSSLSLKQAVRFAQRHLLGVPPIIIESVEVNGKVVEDTSIPIQKLESKSISLLTDAYGFK